MSDLVCGVRRQGKSTWALYRAIETGRSVAIYDPYAQFRGQQFRETSDLDNFREFLDCGDSDFIVYRPLDSPYEEFEGFIREFESREATVLVDEVSELKRGGFLHPSLSRFQRNHNPDYQTIIQTTHSPVDVGKICRNLATDWFIFRLYRLDDLEWIAKEFSPELAGAVTKLDRHHLAHWSEDRHSFELILDPGTWYRDLGH
jgi:hypothetical protein